MPWQAARKMPADSAPAGIVVSTGSGYGGLDSCQRPPAVSRLELARYLSVSKRSATLVGATTGVPASHHWPPMSDPSPAPVPTTAVHTARYSVVRIDKNQTRHVVANDVDKELAGRLLKVLTEMRPDDHFAVQIE